MPCGITHDRETLHPNDFAGLPWQVFGTELFEFSGQMYLLVTDFYSKYFKIDLLCQNTAVCVIKNLKKIFARFGIPEKVASDNRPQHSNTRHLLSRNHELKKFADWAFSHTTSSAEYPQSNGAVERVVQTQNAFLRRLLQRTKTHLRNCCSITLQHPIQRYWCVTCTAADESAHSNNDTNSSKSLGTSASGS